MNNYVIITDSACDIAPEILKEWNVECIKLNFHFNENDEACGKENIDVKEFYNKMREGGIAKTSAINLDTFENEFEKYLKNGSDIFYLSFSSGLSTTYNSSRIAADELRDKYPEQKIVCVDSLCASAGQGLLIYLIAKHKETGASIEKLTEYAEKLVPNICHWFTVDDLVYLKRGGRISPTTAFVGNMLGIKPVLHVDDNGKLVNITKVRGRRASLKALADKLGETTFDKENGTIFISHADCMEDAKTLANIIKETYGGTVDLITDIGPVIGAHSGPGTVALFFLGKER